MFVTADMGDILADISNLVSTLPIDTTNSPQTAGEKSKLNIA
jgi:hypothetical protein